MSKNNELIRPGYWIGHILAVVATIVGVYLAASVGFKKAVELELLRADRGTYYVAKSLLSQTEVNLAQFDEFIQKTNGKSRIKDEIQGIHLNDFVIQSAKFSESTFELDPQVLTEVSQFYSNLRASFDAYHPEKPEALMESIRKETEFMKSGPLERLEKHVSELHDLCESKGLDL